LPKNSGLEEYKSKLEELPNQKMIVRGEDVAFFVEAISKKGVKCIGLTGEDLFKEYKFKEPLGGVTQLQKIPWVEEGAMFGKPTLCLLGPQGKSLTMLDKSKANSIAISSKYKSIANNYLGKLEQKGFSFEKIFLTGSVETAAKMGIADLVIDIVSSGRSAKEAGLRVYDRIMESDLVLVGVRE
jgi:ATP phosphoribosyltransferase